jgi:hypothetical protein
MDRGPAMKEEDPVRSRGSARPGGEPAWVPAPAPGAIEARQPRRRDEGLARSAWAQAGLSYKVETWHAKHGWVLRDTPAYDLAEGEHHWRALVPLMEAVLLRHSRSVGLAN